MKNRFALILLALLFPFYLLAQNETIMIPYRDGNKWGFCDTLGKILVSPNYDSTSNVKLYNYYRDSYDYADYKWKGFGVVRSGRKIGLLNSKAVVIIPVDYSEIFDSEKGFLVSRNGKQGFVGENGIEYFK